MALARAALTAQLARLRLTAHPGWATVVTAKVGPAQRAAAHQAALEGGGPVEVPDAR